ncbi:MAG: BspA family leucine-rich repeat surface protein [Oscillibacter sp.]|nr:BspA family leucine-rich repeat surface protein [Oscillibacter sp.]
MRMTKRLCILILVLIPLLVPVSAAEEAGPGRVEIQNQAYAENVFSCDVRLSGADARGHIFAVLFAESGQMKNAAEYPAQETLQLRLPGVASTDYLHILWTDEAYTPIVGPEIRRMRDNGAQAYADFEEALNRELRTDGPSASDGANRLLVSCTAALDWDDFEGLDTVIPGPNYHYVLQFGNAAQAAQCKEALEAMPSVRYVEFDAMMSFERETDTQEDTARMLDAGDLPELPLSWGVGRSGIGQYAEELRRQGIDREIVVAVVDSGVDRRHDFLSGFLLDGHSSLQQNPSVQDEFGHGTHVAGIIADCVRGLNIRILPVRVLDRFGNSDPVTIANGIYYAANHGAHVINLSLGYSNHKQWIDDAIEYALSKNVTVVVAACNFNTDASACCPAHIRDCITVGALERDGTQLRRWGQSNYGATVDLSAAGGAVNSSVPGNQYQEDSGTSMAAPHVSAAAALLLCERGTSLSPSQISNALKNAAEPLTLHRPLGAGFLNMRPFFQRCTVTFQDGATPPMTVLYGASVTLPSSAFVTNGYSFVEWFDDAGHSYQAGQTLTVTEDLTLYPVWSEPQGAYALLYSDGELVFQNHDGVSPGRTPVRTYPVPLVETPAQNARWYDERANIRTVVFADSIRPSSTATWFYHCANLTEIRGLENLDTRFVTDMSQMFSGCTSLTSLDLSALDTSSATNVQQMFFDCANLATLDLTGWNTANVTSTADMFNGCAALETVYASETFATDAVSDSVGMFYGCRSLVGGAGTTYSDAHTDKEYARLDGGVSAPGYFSDVNPQYPAVIEVGTVNASPGDTVSVPVSITQNPGIAGAGLDILFDEGLTLTNIRRGDVLSVGIFDFDVSNRLMLWLPSLDALPRNVTDTGVLFTLEFQIPPNTESGTHTVSVALTDGQAENLCNDKLKVVSLEVVPGAVHVAPTPASDIYAVLYGDGELVFQNDNRTDSGRSVTGVYTVDRSYTIGDYAPWYEQRDNITTATFADEIQPDSTACWFCDCGNLTEIRNIRNLDTSNITSMFCMFYQCRSLTSLDVGGFNTSNVTYMPWIFSGCSSLTSLDVSGFDTSNATDIGYMFYGCRNLTSLDVSGFNTSNVTVMSWMFCDCDSLTTLNVSGFDTANVTDMNHMFCRCSSLTALDVSHFNTANVTSMLSMFNGCSGLTALDVSHFDTANVSDMSWMFSECHSLTRLNVSSFDTSQVTTMECMFQHCFALPRVDVSGFDTRKVTNMGGMFYGCYALTELDVRNFNTELVWNMTNTFSYCQALRELDLSGFNTRSVTAIGDMFRNSTLSVIYASDNFGIASEASSDDMFYGCTSLVGGAGTQYDGEHTDKAYARIDGGPNSPGYFTLKNNAVNLSAEELFHLGEDYFNGANGKPQDYAQSIYYYQQSADMGNMYAINDLGYIYQHGYGVAVDYARALQLYERAAEMGNPHALNNLGYMYENGLGVAQDFQRAMTYYQQAADAGSDNAASNLLSLRLRMMLGF